MQFPIYYIFIISYTLLKEGIWLITTQLMFQFVLYFTINNMFFEEKTLTTIPMMPFYLYLLL